MDQLLRKLRAVLGNAVVWGGAWAIGSIVLLTVFMLLGIAPALPPPAALLRIAARFGAMGFAVGAGFGGFVGLVYGRERIGSIPTIPFLLGGAAVAAVLSPLIGGSALIGAVLGGATAGLTLGAAKRAEARALTAGPDDRLLEG